jgi:hypothetical protein
VRCPAPSSVSDSLPLEASPFDGNLGVVRASWLVLYGWSTRYNEVSHVFKILLHTALPRLRQLRIANAPTKSVALSTAALRLLDPQDAVFYGQPPVQPIPDALAARLRQVEVKLKGFRRLERAHDFLSFFGAANRPEILQVLPKDLELVD